MAHDLKGWIGVDLDGTLAHYDGWQGADHIGEPIPAMLERVKRWIADGREVRILTARVSHDGSPSRVREAHFATVAIINWCGTHLGSVLPVTCTKDYAMIELWDDRAVTVVANTGEPCCARALQGSRVTQAEEVAKVELELAKMEAPLAGHDVAAYDAPPHDLETPPNPRPERVTLSGAPPVSGYDQPAPNMALQPNGQHTDYWVLSDEERSKGFVRPVNRSYVHLKCNTVTTMGVMIAETYARNPKFYGATFCVACKAHFPVGEQGEFIWHGVGEPRKVGT